MATAAWSLGMTEGFLVERLEIEGKHCLLENTSELLSKLCETRHCGKTNLARV